MKQFKTDYFGLLPIYLDDFRFLQESYDEQIEALILPLLAYASQDSFILTGCEQTGDDSYNPGWVVLNGKIYRFTGGNFLEILPGYKRVWYVDSLVLSGGLKKPLRQEVSVNTWYDHVANIKNVAEESEGIDVDLPRYSDVVKLMVRQDTGWVAPSLSANWSYPNEEQRPRYRVLNGVTYLTGRATKATEGTNTIFIMPSVARPAREYVLPSWLTGAGMYIVPGAATEVVSFDGGLEVLVRLDGIAYPTV